MAKEKFPRAKYNNFNIYSWAQKTESLERNLRKDMESEDTSKGVPKEDAITKTTESSNATGSLSVAKSQSHQDSGDEEETLELGCKAQEATFPQQLMDVIERETANGSSTSAGEKVLEWLPNGDAFIIRDKALFEREVLPKHFSAKCKFMSFVRKLYRYVQT